MAGTDGTLFVWNPQTNTATEVALEGAGTGMIVVSGPRRVAWGNGGGNGDAGEYVLDLASGKLWRVGEAAGLSVIYASGDYIAWSKLGILPAEPKLNKLLVAKWIGG